MKTIGLEIPESVKNRDLIFGTRKIDVILLSNWGHGDLIGLTGLELTGINDDLIDVAGWTLSCNAGSDYNLLKLINGRHLTVDPRNMWKTQLHLSSDAEPIIITFTFETEIFLSGKCII